MKPDAFGTLWVVLSWLAFSGLVGARALDSTIDEYITVAPVFYYPSGPDAAGAWKYTTQTPAPGWNAPGFDDSSWSVGLAGFGSNPPDPGDVVSTTWTTGELYLRRTVTLSAPQLTDLALFGRYDDAIEIYVNGVLGYSSQGLSDRYRFVGLASSARAALVSGSNLIAVRVRNFGGAGYFDLGVCANPLIGLPIQGAVANPALSVFGSYVAKLMEDNGVPAGVLAVMKEDRIVVSQSFGYAKRDLSAPVVPNAPMRLASLDKPITGAAVYRLVSSGKLNPVTGLPMTMDTPVLPILLAAGVQPLGGVAGIDPLMYLVTVRHLLDHQSGVVELPWYPALAQAFGKPESQISLFDNLAYVLGMPLAFVPGTQGLYSSSGYMLLRGLLEVLEGGFEDHLRLELAYETGDDDIFVCHELPAGRLPDEPWYATDENSYPRWIYLERYLALAARPEALARHLRRYHLFKFNPLEDPITGQWAPVPDNGGWIFNGSYSGTFSVAIQRLYDQVNIVLILNQSGDYVEIEDVNGKLWQLADQIQSSGWAGEVSAPSYEVYSGSPPNPSALQVLSTSAQSVLGNTISLALDHSTFAPTALADFYLLCAERINLPGSIGTLIANIAGPTIQYVVPAGAALDLTIPLKAAFIGREFYLQAAGVSASSALLANAIGIRIGTF